MKNSLSSLVVASLALVPALLAGPAARGDTPPPRAYRVGKVLTMDTGKRVVNNAVVLVKDGTIQAVEKARGFEIPEEYEVLDHPELWLLPGLVDPHNHTMGGIQDLNDMVYLTNPGLDSLSAVTPEGEETRHAKEGGVTTVLVIPGSGTNQSGFGTITKTAGKSVEEMVVKSPGALKVAQAGNPERYWYGVGRSFMNYNLRQTLDKARAYHEAWKLYEEGKLEEKPEYDPQWEGFRDVFERKTVVAMHTQMYQVLMKTVLMFCRGMKLHVILDHCTFDAWKVAPLFKDLENVYTSNGPRQFYFDRTQRKMMGHAARWWQGGIRKLGINTDAVYRGGITQEDLSYQAAMACWYGWEPYPALVGITRFGAEALQLDDRIGTVEPGKEADLSLWTGDPLDPRSYCVLTVIAGRIVYNAEEGRRF